MRAATFNLLLLTLTLAAAGCSSSMSYNQQALARETYTANPPHAVFDTQALAQAHAPSSQWQAWRTRRNDPYLNLRPQGNLAPTADHVVHIEDRQRSFGDDIHNVHRRVFRSIQYNR